MTGTLCEISEYRGNTMLGLLRYEGDDKPMRMGLGRAIKLLEKTSELVEWVESGAGDDDKRDFRSSEEKYPLEVTGAQARFILQRLDDIQAFIAQEKAKPPKAPANPSGKFKVTRVFKVNDSGNLKAFVKVMVGDVLEIEGFRIIDGRNGLFLAMPSRRKPDDTYEETATPVNKDARAELQALAIDAYHQAA